MRGKKYLYKNKSLKIKRKYQIMIKLKTNIVYQLWG